MCLKTSEPIVSLRMFTTYKVVFDSKFPRTLFYGLYGTEGITEIKNLYGKPAANFDRGYGYTSFLKQRDAENYLSDITWSRSLYFILKVIIPPRTQFALGIIPTGFIGSVDTMFYKMQIPGIAVRSKFITEYNPENPDHQNIDFDQGPHRPVD